MRYWYKAKRLLAFGEKGALAALLMTGVFVVVLAGCSAEKTEQAGADEGASYGEQAAGGEGALPEGHPAMGEEVEEFAKVSHSMIKAQKAVMLPEEVVQKWKEVDIEVTDRSTNTKETLKLKVGEEVSLKDTGFSLRVEHFVPDYTMVGDHITSRSNEPNNPAVLVELTKGGESLARGWVFTQLPEFNSYKHERIELTLLAPGSE